jgi:hypothetical protein
LGLTSQDHLLQMQTLLKRNEMASAIVLTFEQWFLLSAPENTDGGLIINLNEMQKTPDLYQSKETISI